MKLDPPDWMRNCGECAKRVEALETTPDPHPLKEFEAVREHLVEAHLALLPGYFTDCANCQEWVALGPDASPPSIVPVLGREALLHRAGHLLTS